MELTRTINSDQRYYLDEDSIENADSLLQTFELFNDYKMDMYNRLYEQRFLQEGPLFGKTGTPACSYLKQKYHTNDYYNAAIYTAASGQVSAQNEQRRLHKKTITADIENREKKIQLTKEELTKKLAIKDSIRNYAKTGRWVKPYPKCTLKVHKDTIKWYGKEPISLAEYERSVEKRIRELKHKLAMLQEALKRKAKKLEDNEKYAPRRIVFGTRKCYKEKDSKDVDKIAWANEFYFQRHSSLTLPGRHTSKYGNFLCKYIGSNLHVTCMDGKETVFYDFWPVQYQQEFLANFKADPKERKAVCYSFKLVKEAKGRIYIIPSITMTITVQENKYLDHGCIGMDINWDHLALSELDADGNRLGGKIIPLPLEGKSSGRVTNIIGRAVQEVFRYCIDKQKPLVMEDIDLVIKRHQLKYGSRTGNRHISLVSYAKIGACVQNQVLRTAVPAYKVDPAYTSQIGKFLFMRKYGISIHSAASYAIGLKGLGKISLMIPDERILRLVSIKEDEKNPFNAIWRNITAAFAKVPKHRFYGQIPYEALNQKERPTLRTLANAMVM